jgi:hypothetical protein
LKAAFYSEANGLRQDRVPPGQRLRPQWPQGKLPRIDIRERQLLRMRYEPFGEQPLSPGDIDKLLHLSKERIQRIEESTILNLRQPQHAPWFTQFFHDSPHRLAAILTLRSKEDCKERITCLEVRQRDHYP